MACKLRRVEAETPPDCAMDVESGDEAISASCSARRSCCWVWAKGWMGIGVGMRGTFEKWRVVIRYFVFRRRGLKVMVKG